MFRPPQAQTQFQNQFSIGQNRFGTQASPDLYNYCMQQLQIPPSLSNSVFLSQQREYLMQQVRQGKLQGNT
jgi:hypothetical protein